ncbi:MAG: energy-coupling factor ABC transporter ATP-binding protein [Spirochaetaceae bacterium]|jgi:cobalt/nickel transport system ATP-binding protein|nr:energy-coupling factor ABC transporter ATP-binding protein [Spirochaetaceae bacterium]
MISSQIEVKEIAFLYPNGHRALNRISFNVDANEALGIIGPNGAGKSTLLQILIGILPVQEGEILIDGMILDKKNLPSIRKKTGLLFQNPDDQLFCPTVRDDVSFGPVNMGLEAEEIEATVNKAMETARISHLAERPPYTLSGGEKKAVALASILSMEPEILLMDETSANLDPRSRSNLVRIINTLPQSKIIVSHDLDFIWDTCTRVIILNNGTITSQGKTEEILSDRALLEKNELLLPLRLQGCPLCGESLSIGR